LAYFAGLRKDCDDDQLAAWKASWKIKKDTWNKKRQPGSIKKRKIVFDDGGVEEEKESEPPREKVSSKKTQSLLIKADDGTPVHHL